MWRTTYDSILGLLFYFISVKDLPLFIDDAIQSVDLYAADTTCLILV